MREHDFGPMTPDYRVKCRRCGFEQYSAAPQPSTCLSDDDLEERMRRKGSAFKDLFSALCEAGILFIGIGYLCGAFTNDSVMKLILGVGALTVYRLVVRADDKP